MACEIIRRGDMRAPAAVPPRPTRWSTERCRDLLFEAMLVDGRQTPLTRPRPTGNAHLTCAHTAEDRAEWETFELDADRLPPTREEKAKAEKVLGWPQLLRDGEADLRHALLKWVRAEVVRDYLAAAKALSVAAKALEIIAGRLNASGVPAF